MAASIFDAAPPHCLMVPFPFTGHINPMLPLSKRLAKKNLKVTLALTNFTVRTNPNFTCEPVEIRPISDGFDEGGRAQAKDSVEYNERLEKVGRESLAELLRELAGSGHSVDCVIYDPFMPWALDVAKELGLKAAAFFTQSAAVDNIYHQVYSKNLKLPLSEDDKVVVLPGLPPLKPDELPSFIYIYGSYPYTFPMLLNQFRNVNEADWFLINTFSELEKEVVEWMSVSWNVKPIGPTIPSLYLDKRLPHDEEYGLSFNSDDEPAADSCIKWLEEQNPRSVIYVSFGSLARVDSEQTSEIAKALKSMDKPFLWVVHAFEQDNLPKDDDYFSALPYRKGLIVSWCPQLQVLAHESVGCFITHCGWNSTLEALSLGVPLVAMPQWTDQGTNAKFVEDVWEVGVRAKKDGDGVVREEEIVRCVNSVMEGKEIRERASKWKEIARMAVDEGGSSDKNLDEFASALKAKG